MSRLQYLAVDYDADGKCYVYVTDAANRAIIAWDVAESKGWRVMLPKGIASGCVRRDVLYAVLVRAQCGTATALVVTYLSGARVFSIRTEYLRKGTTGKTSDLGVKPDKMVRIINVICVILIMYRIENGFYFAFAVSGVFGRRRRHGPILPVRSIAGSLSMGRDQTVLLRKLRSGLPVGTVLPSHSSDGRPSPEPVHGVGDELPRLHAKHCRLRYRSQRPRTRRMLLNRIS